MKSNKRSIGSSNRMNVFKNLSALEQGEQFETWLSCKNVVIERIVSADQPDLATYALVHEIIAVTDFLGISKFVPCLNEAKLLYIAACS